MGSLPPTANGLASPLAVQRNGEKPADRNIKEVVLGDVQFDTWYPSFYPEELVGREIDRLYVCQWCFKYSKDRTPYVSHIVRLHTTPILACANCLHSRHVLGNTLLHQAKKSTRAPSTPSTRSTAKSTNSSRKAFPSSPNFSLTTNPSSMTSPPSTTTSSSTPRLP